MTEKQIEQFTRAMRGLIEGLKLRSRALRIHSDRVITVDADGDIQFAKLTEEQVATLKIYQR